MWHAPVLLAVVGLAVLGWTGAAAEPTPGVRNGHAMAYDTVLGRVVLFGGADASKVRGDTWTWNGAAWTLAASDGPPPRTFPAMAWDGSRRRTVLFGGNRVLFGADPPADDTFLADTWEWDGRRWEHAAVTGPPPRAEAAIAFDAKRGRIVLFGGYTRKGGEIRRFGDTWEWNGSLWAEVPAKGPSPRNGASAAYDGPREATVLVGGRAPAGTSPETWLWSGRVWNLLGAALPEGIFNCALAFDSGRGRVVRFGGYRAKSRVGETWELEGSSWKLVSSSGPSARNHAAMAYDSDRRRIVLYGGHDGERVFGDTWEWDGRSWLLQNASAPEPHEDNGH